MNVVTEWIRPACEISVNIVRNSWMSVLWQSGLNPLHGTLGAFRKPGHNISWTDENHRYKSILNSPIYLVNNQVGVNDFILLVWDN